jgi:pilus assembly protein Flp/PilA
VLHHLTQSFLHLVRDEEGATAIEYGLIAALVAVAAITSMKGLGGQLKTTFNTTSSSMSAANATAAA